VQTKDNPADLINVALEELVRERCELPGYTTLDAMTATIRTEVNGRFHAMVAARPDRAARAGLDRLLLVDPATRRSDFDRIKTPAKAPTLGKFKQRLAHLRELDTLGPTEAWLHGVPPSKIAHFAGEAKMAGVDDMRKCGDAKRVMLLISLLHQQRIEARDEVVTMFCKRMAAIHKKGKERLEELREAYRAESERLIGVFGEVMAGAREATAPPGVDSDREAPAPPRDCVAGPFDDEVAQRAGRVLLKTLESAGGLEELSAAHEAVSAHHGNNYLPLLEGFYRSHRSALFTLVDSLELEPTTADRSVLDAVEFIRANRDRRSDWIPAKTTHTVEGQDIMLAVDVEAFASVAWRKVLCEGAAGDAGAAAPGSVRVLPAGRRAALRGRGGDRIGLLCQPQLPAHVLAGVRAAGRAVLRAGGHPHRGRRPGGLLQGAAHPHRDRGGRRLPREHRSGVGAGQAGAQAPQGR
jgi:hypothetical protein